LKGLCHPAIIDRRDDGLDFFMLYSVTNAGGGLSKLGLFFACLLPSGWLRAAFISEMTFPLFDTPVAA
jgi:hypothetical protein